MSSAPNDLRSRLFWAATRSTNLAQALRLASIGCDATQQPLLDSFGDAMKSVTGATTGLESDLTAINETHGEEWLEFAAYIALSRVGEVSAAPLVRLESVANSLLPTNSYVWPLLRAVRTNIATKAGEPSQAALYLGQAETALACVDSPALRELCRPTVLRARGLYFRLIGDYQKAFIALESAQRIASELSMNLAPFIALDFGHLLWSSGQVQRALEVHQDEAGREALRSVSREMAARSHLSAAKCAIDLSAFSTAEKELRAVEQLQRESEGISALVNGYYQLFSGELHLKSAASTSSNGFDLLEKACQIFESMDPPYHAGLLDAKISITQYAIRTDDYKRLFAILHNILEEAEQKGCLEARARCLVFESSLFVSESPPLRAAFDDLVTRLHLINNPALLMQALANLFAYSLRYLEQPDQAFLMARLRNLQEVLDESCYQDLYESYIEKRYSWAIENRLAEFLETDEKLFEDEGDKEPTT